MIWRKKFLHYIIIITLNNNLRFLHHTPSWLPRLLWLDLDFLAFCVLAETTGTTADDLDEDGAKWPWLPRAVMDWSSRPGPEPTTLEAVGDQWCYALVVQAKDDDDDDDDAQYSTYLSFCIWHHYLDRWLVQ